MMRTLFLQAPSFDGFDGGAGSRYQARREIRSFWYPTWLAQAAAVVPGSKLIDAHAARIAARRRRRRGARLRSRRAAHLDALLRFRRETWSKRSRPPIRRLRPASSAPRSRSSRAASLRCFGGHRFRRRQRIRFHHQGNRRRARLDAHHGAVLSRCRRRDRHNRAARRSSKTWTNCRSSRRSTSATSTIENYFIGYLKHPYISLYTGRGCKSRCTFCLWPQTVGGHRYRTRSVGHVIDEMRWAKQAFPQVKEFFFDDDTFTDDRAARRSDRARDSASSASPGRATPRPMCRATTLKVMRDNGLRLLLVGYESGNQQILHNIKKGMRVDVARRFTKDCHELGITIHGTFILGPAGREQGDDRGDDPVRHRDQPAHHPGFARRALSGHVPVSSRRSRTAGSTTKQRRAGR